MTVSLGVGPLPVRCSHLTMIRPVVPRTPQGCRSACGSALDGWSCACASPAGMSAAATPRWESMRGGTPTSSAIRSSRRICRLMTGAGATSTRRMSERAEPPAGARRETDYLYPRTRLVVVRRWAPGSRSSSHRPVGRRWRRSTSPCCALLDAVGVLAVSDIRRLSATEPRSSDQRRIRWRRLW